LIDEMEKVAGEGWPGFASEEECIEQARARAVSRFVARTERAETLRSLAVALKSRGRRLPRPGLPVPDLRVAGQVGAKTYIKPLLIKAVAAFLVVALNWFGLQGVMQTRAFFSDTESSGQNDFVAGVLDIEAGSDSGFSPRVTPDTNSARSLAVSNTGSLDAYHTITTDNFSDTGLCDSLSAEVTIGSHTYTQPLIGLEVASIELATGSVENLDFTVSLVGDDPVLQNKTCSFDIVFNAWQSNFSGPEKGFSDREAVESSLSSGSWDAGQTETTQNQGVVLNEFIPNPKGYDSHAKPDGEWVELYNLSDKPVDLSGYFLTDADGHRIDIEPCRVGSSTTIISANGFLVVYRKGGPDCTSHYFSLNNDEDTVSLYKTASTGEDILINEVEYNATDDCDSVPSKGKSNKSGCSKEAEENKTYARLPDGTGKWYDPVPTPGAPNVLEEDAVEDPVTVNSVQGLGDGEGDDASADKEKDTEPDINEDKGNKKEDKGDADDGGNEDSADEKEESGKTGDDKDEKEAKVKESQEGEEEDDGFDDKKSKKDKEEDGDEPATEESGTKDPENTEEDVDDSGAEDQEGGQEEDEDEESGEEEPDRKNEADAGAGEEGTTER